MKILFLIIALWPSVLWAQSATVLPEELSLEVSVNETDEPPYLREMVLITIRGVYRRHITRERLQQPDFDGFNWMQLGPDSWSEERIRGQKVKILERRMALFPERTGTLTIGAFTHNLTLTDEKDDWFDHQITSEPVMIQVAPAPVVEGEDWWFPVRRLRVSDQWSNAPDQLQPGEGVLRVIRVEALGAAPEMIPPMPELTSPSAMIFPHPEKRLVELSPEGPVTYAFWRWTIRPTNDVSGIIEPLSFSYFDTTARVGRSVTISAQRVAFDAAAVAESVPPPSPARLPGRATLALGFAVFLIGLVWLLAGHRYGGLAALRRYPMFDPLARVLVRAERTGDLPAMRRAAAAIVRRDGTVRGQRALLAELDRQIHDPVAKGVAPVGFARAFLGQKSVLERRVPATGLRGQSATR